MAQQQVIPLPDIFDAVNLCKDEQTTLRYSIRLKYVPFVSLYLPHTLSWAAFFTNKGLSIVRWPVRTEIALIVEA